MAVSLIENAFVIGELSPGLFGRTDLARNKVAATTMRNMYVNYRGGASSRAGTMFVGFSKQTGRTVPPKLLPFQFNVNQGLMLEFGNFYMRVIKNGAFVVDNAVAITNVAIGPSTVLTVAAAVGGLTATPDNSTVFSSYAPGNLVTLAGGSFVTPAQVAITNTKIIGLQSNAGGQGYVQGDTISLVGGVQSTPAQLTVLTTRVSAIPTIANPGAGGTPGTATVIGTTGTGTKFQATVTIDGTGVIVAVTALITGGSYTVNPASLTNAPVTGGGLVGAQLAILMGVNTFSITNAGVFTGNPFAGQFTQNATSGVGVGATFQFALMAPNAVTVPVPGNYTVFPSNPVQQASTTGTGAGGQFNVTPTAVAPFVNGDWVQVAAVNGTTELNGETYVVGNAGPTSFQLYDVYGAPIDSTAYGLYAGGGTASRIFTLTTIYAEADLQYLKYTQSADVMSLCCVNQMTGTEYIEQDLARTTDSNWSLAPPSIAATIGPPQPVSVLPTSVGAVGYSYQVTAVNADDGSESIAQGTFELPNGLNFNITQGAVRLVWGAPVGNVLQYNVYKASPGYGFPVPGGSLYGFIASAYGTVYNDTNVTPDFTQVPPRHINPFARGRVLGIAMAATGGGYTFAVVSITSGTGSGFVGQAVIGNTGVFSIVVLNAGQNYRSTDTVNIVGDGGGAVGFIKVGPLTGTYPSVPAYFQQRRVYANTRNQPDTYFMSQPGSFTNFDFRIPTIDDDAITGTPWSVQVDGIQAMIPMPGGLLVFTGASAWQVGGVGGSAVSPQPISPNSQQALQQAFNGISPILPPIPIDYNILYFQVKSSVVRNLAYNFYTNIYTGEDITLNSSHLFTGLTFSSWCWAEEPYKLAWAVREDGIMLPLCFVKPQEVQGWSRVDTNGLFVGVQTITELPTDAVYVATQRFPGGHTAYMIERMDDRLWDSIEDSWCVDAGLASEQDSPAAMLTASSATGAGKIISVAVDDGGVAYSTATTARIVDDKDDGPGAGATLGVVVVGGVIMAINVLTQGADYTFPEVVIEDPTNQGAGAEATAALENLMTFSASVPTFNINDTGSVIRMGGGIAEIIVGGFISTTQVTANMIVPITDLIPNTSAPKPMTAGNWTLTQPFMQVTGLAHLAGATVTGLYDGKVLPPTIVPINGRINLPEPATTVIVGLGYRVQLQGVYLDGGSPTVQGRRKTIPAMTARVQDSGRFQMGCNQTDGSTLSPKQIAVLWQNMAEALVPDLGSYLSDAVPLFTGDVRIPIDAGFDTPGQAAIQQDLPLPLNLLAFIPEVVEGDETQTQAKQRGK